MEKVEWSESYSVGVSEIDFQHQTLFRFLNRLIADSDSTTRSETVSDTLMEMTRYAQEHFIREETLMALHGYPDLPAHRALHREFRKKTVEFCQAAMLDVAIVPTALENYLVEWLINHILIEDQRFAPYMQE